MMQDFLIFFGWIALGVGLATAVIFALTDLLTGIFRK